MHERLRITDGLAQIPESGWRELAFGHPAMRLEVLKAIENSPTRQLNLQVFLLENDAGLAAAAICESVTAPDAHNALDSLLFGRAMRAARMLAVSTLPALLFSPPLGNEAPVLLQKTSPGERRRLLDRLLDGIEAHAAERGLGIAFLGVPDDEEMLTEALRDRRYLETEVQKMTCLDVEWSDFEGYVDHLRRRSKSAAGNARKERNRNRDGGVQIRLVPGNTVDTLAFFTLVREHYRHKNGRDLPFGPHFLPQLIQALGDDFLVFEAERHGQRVAMLGVVRSGNVGWPACFGIDLRNRPNDFTYFNLVYYHLADCAAGLGLRTLLYGNGAYQAKLKRGCRLMVNRLFYHPYRPLWRLAAGPYFRIHRAWYRRKLR
jgi:predicted N-acyltransferase